MQILQFITQNTMFDIITIGDTTTDIFLDIDEESFLCKVDKKKMELKLKFSGKIPVKSVHRVTGGGNAANHAIGATRLGLKTAIYTIVGEDDAGDDFCHKLEKEKVSNKYVKFDSKNSTNLSSIIDYEEERTVLSYHADRKYKLPVFDKTEWIYFSSICGNHAQFSKELINYIKNKKIKLGFNPGSRQMSLGVKKLKPIFAVSEIVFVNRQEAKRLTKNTDDIKVLLREMKKTGPKVVVITDGKKGSYCYDGKSMYKFGIFESSVVETTGCGDAYSCGFVAAIIRGKDLAEAMRWGTANSASVLSKIGSQDGLLSEVEIERVLNKNSNLKAKVL